MSFKLGSRKVYAAPWIARVTGLLSVTDRVPADRTDMHASMEFSGVPSRNRVGPCDQFRHDRCSNTGLPYLHRPCLCGQHSGGSSSDSYLKPKPVWDPKQLRKLFLLRLVQTGEEPVVPFTRPWCRVSSAGTPRVSNGQLVGSSNSSFTPSSCSKRGRTLLSGFTRRSLHVSSY